MSQYLPMGKFFAALIILLVLTLVAEGGYFIGRRSVKTAPAQRAPAIQISQTSIPTPPTSTLPSSQSEILQSLFAPETVAHFVGTSKDFISQSEWLVGIWGKFVKMDNDSITMSLDGNIKQFLVPKTATLVLNKWSESRHVESPAKAEEMLSNEDVTIYLTLETITGKIIRVQLTKSIE